MMVQLLTHLVKATDRLLGFVLTQSAREIVELGPGARLTRTGRIDNIGRVRSHIRIGYNSVVAGHLQTFAHAGRIEIGSWCYVGEGSRVWSAAEVIIEDRVLISHNVGIIDTSSHPIDAESRFKQTRAILSHGHPKEDPGLTSSPIRVCNDAWISYGAAILSGVTIGEGAIVGACSVVTKDVEPWTIVAGNPAKLVRRLARESAS